MASQMQDQGPATSQQTPHRAAAKVRSCANSSVDVLTAGVTPCTPEADPHMSQSHTLDAAVGSPGACDRMSPVAIRTKGWATMKPPCQSAKHSKHESAGVVYDPVLSQEQGHMAACPLKPLPASYTRLDTWKQAHQFKQAEQLKHTSHYLIQVRACIISRTNSSNPSRSVTETHNRRRFAGDCSCLSECCTPSTRPTAQHHLLCGLWQLGLLGCHLINVHTKPIPCRAYTLFS